MGQLLGGGLTKATGVSQGGQDPTFYKTPEQASAMAHAESAVPTKMFDQGNVDVNPPAPVNLDPNAPPAPVDPNAGAINLKPTTMPATTVKPSFMQAATDDSGRPNATSPALTKGGKLLTILSSGLKGGLAGAGSWTVGEGFQKGNALPFEEQQRTQALRGARAENTLKEAQVQMLPWQRQIMASNLGKTQAEIKQVNAKSVLDEAEALKDRYHEVQGLGLYDLKHPSGKPTPVPGTTQLVPLTADQAKIGNLPTGHQVPVEFAKKLQDLADAGYEKVDANGHVYTVDKANHKIVKDWGKSNPMVLNQVNNPLANTEGAAGSGATGEDLLAKLSPSQRTFIKGVANYEFDPDASKTRGVSGAQARILAKQYSPSYDDTQYKTKESLRKDITSGTTSKVIRNLNTATGHINQLDQAVDALQNSDFPTLTKVANELGFQVGSDKMTNFNTVKTAVVGELAAIYKGTGQATDAEIENVQHSIGSSNSPEQLKGSIDEAIHLMHSRLEAVGFGYNQGLKDPKDFQLVSPTSRTVFEKHGVKIDPTVMPTHGSTTTPAAKPKNPLEEKYKDLGAVFPGTKP